MYFYLKLVFLFNISSFKSSKSIFKSILPINGTLTGTINPGKSGPGSNGKEGVFHIP